VGSPHLRITRRGIEHFCSATCRAMADEPSDLGERISRARQTSRRSTALVIGISVMASSPCSSVRPTARATREPTVLATVAPTTDLTSLTESETPYGPFAPTEDQLADEFALSLGVDGWVHPLQGPRRRMPIRTTRAFGAERPGDHRPYECRSGHCGVDIGGEQWGERVMAAASGTVVKVNRDSSRSGGKYLRLSHRGGTVFTQYFHLAAIPRHLRRGRKIRAGEVVGLLGETGVENSGPHLHFTVSVKPTLDSREVYVDPEPLIALWPLRHIESAAVARLSPPGVPIGASGSRKRTRRARARERPALRTLPPPQSASAAPMH
jgi:hypothetical protein